MEADDAFYRPDRANEAEPEYSTAELRERKALTDSIVRNMKLVAAVDVAELEILERRVRAIIRDLKIIKDDATTRELNAEQ